MLRARWYDPLLTFLAEQPAETTSITLTFAEVAACVGAPLSAFAATRTFWCDRKPRSVGAGLAVFGWRVAHVHGRPLTITFVRCVVPLDTPA